MSVKLVEKWDVEIGASVKKEDWENVKAELSGISKAFQEELDHITEITWDEFKEYSIATAKDVSKRWESTTKDMKTLAAKSMWGTVSAWFEDDMDQVEDIWDNAWDSMIGKADKAWDGFLNKVVERLQRLIANNKGPEGFPGALSFRLAA